MRNAYIHSVGAYAPEKVIPNSYFNDLLGEDVDTWLRENLTIRERRWCGENESTADLSVEAAKSALERGNINPSEIDLIIVATDTPEFISPSTASVVQYRLNADKIRNIRYKYGVRGICNGTRCWIKIYPCG